MLRLETNPNKPWFDSLRVHFTCHVEAGTIESLESAGFYEAATTIATRGIVTYNSAIIRKHHDRSVGEQHDAAVEPVAASKRLEGNTLRQRAAELAAGRGAAAASSASGRAGQVRGEAVVDEWAARVEASKKSTRQVRKLSAHLRTVGFRLQQNEKAAKEELLASACLLGHPRGLDILGSLFASPFPITRVICGLILATLASAERLDDVTLLRKIDSGLWQVATGNCSPPTRWHRAAPSREPLYVARVAQCLGGASSQIVKRFIWWLSKTLTGVAEGLVLPSDPTINGFVAQLLLRFKVDGMRTPGCSKMAIYLFLCF
ncbi:hypothetical protein FOL46_006477 [Perkinsus olseni]|uniref:Uncharacterized protein n=1 Tax=Perkinsus olseni TaxID=32597 RepID=A0A7J6MR14_PEROL|nr:hypothetical protein FOL46_006477 [Perkinsus olseni]